MADGSLQFYDKVATKFESYDAQDFAAAGFRVVPPAVARKGAFIGKNVVLMPSYVNVGAYVDEGAMIDTWATVGSCAQIGKNVHLRSEENTSEIQSLMRTSYDAFCLKK